MANAFDFPYEYPEMDPYLRAYFQIVAPRRSAERWVVEPHDLWDELGDFA